ncbi:RNA-binding protein [bacterium (Candidatus Blackallbacteria) CG17_big_fil_post_rev_8_21_14_2_50_48_46]|uniref:RNA-binding protein n=1 Tax=bacterium (Candidatus Blackallbacteria) CG17_big_fil_post_rev_8_21_14_2_50_48_46 TaxID=2014261 RepID=A0A2M7G1R8_9BACT|nr:MAG: RNA-binding protein [bacterium (Candidatus Blackallbacteria) CG18_big_fil_WC_8_21_14_2_50_49_26]PIW15676.1 MAG: RNA-binding protein [bacterium (Candidatus Blackallbacteria) CG17_big_fil_post_rev_8_21_14_2_50_48_46]PIW48681.1 MAG: RNA-binding protein [bacterium (Candidatus Blackallbacteria) CG13_big_fil_rev_8_21_14_2_50_49_14]
MSECAIQTEVIELAQFLKLADLCQTGGEAKYAIQNGEVMLNGELETRRSKKLHPGDVVAYQGREVKVVKA